MTYWNIGDEECNDPDFLANPAAAGLYYLAGSSCMRQIYNRRGDDAIPVEWFVPDHFVTSIKNGPKLDGRHGLQRHQLHLLGTFPQPARLV